MALKKREKILIFFVLIAAAVWAFDRFYYRPQEKKMKGLREEIKAADQRIKESSLFDQGLERIEAEVSQLEKEFERLSQKMLRGDEFRAFLKHLGSESERLRMKMVSMNTEEEMPAPPEGKGSPPEDRYRKVGIEMVLHSGFYALWTYLRGIEELPFLVAVEELEVERVGEGASPLKVTMGLSVFVTR